MNKTHLIFAVIAGGVAGYAFAGKLQGIPPYTQIGNYIAPPQAETPTIAGVPAPVAAGLGSLLLLFLL